MTHNPCDDCAPAEGQCEGCEMNRARDTLREMEKLRDENCKRLVEIIQLRHEIYNNVKDTSEYKEIQAERQRFCLETFKLREEIERLRGPLNTIREALREIEMRSSDPVILEICRRGKA